jgi:hypothetical protein
MKTYWRAEGTDQDGCLWCLSTRFWELVVKW